MSGEWMNHCFSQWEKTALDADTRRSAERAAHAKWWGLVRQQHRTSAAGNLAASEILQPHINKALKRYGNISSGNFARLLKRAAAPKTAGSFSRPAAALGALAGGWAGHDMAKSIGPHRGARALIAGASALSTGLLAGAGVGGIQDGVRVLKKDKQRMQHAAKFDPQIREARWKWEDREKDRLSQKLHGVGYEDSPLAQQQWNEQIGYPAGDRADAMQREVQHLPLAEQLKHWQGLAGTKTAGQLIKAIASPVIGAGKMIGKQVAEKPISTIMGAKAVHSLAKGTIGTVRAARGDIQNAQNQHGTPTQAQYMGARQSRPNPARISQTGSY